MNTFKKGFSVKNILCCIVVTLALLTVSACGGGGGGSAPPPKTTAILTINLTGTLPIGSAITGVAFTLTLPANVTPALTNGAVAIGVVTPSGTFLGGTQATPVYTAATANTPGTIYLTLANAAAAGTSQVGEVATITLQLANGATVTAGDFGFTGGINVTDVLYNSIGGMSANVAGVILQ
jgi:hypothetical protein